MTTNEKVSIKNVEERLNRLTIVIDEKFAALHAELLSLVNGNDTRYQQRFDAQSKALDFAAAAAKEAVTAALAGADKAAIKTEQTADKRFADLGDLIREQFKGLAGRFDALSQRVKTIEDRLNLTTGESQGTKEVKETSRANIALIISIVGGFAGFFGLVLMAMKLFTGK